MIALMLLPSIAISAEIFEDRAFYFGDLHVHTGASGDGYSLDVSGCREDFPDCGSLADVFGQARATGLDFVSVTDHVNHIYSTDERLFDQVHSQALEADDPAGGFVVVPAVELAFSESGGGVLGHKNLYMFGDSAVLQGLKLEDTRFNGDSMEVATCGDIWTWFEDWQKRWGPAWLIPHHPATIKSPHPTDWGCADERYQPLVEIYSKHGNSLTDATSYDLPVGGNDPARTAHAAMDVYGLRMGFISSTDDHHTRPGNTCSHLTVGDVVYGGGLAAVVLDASEPFERGAIGRAMGARSTYATSGPKLPVIVEYIVDGVPVGTLGEVVTLSEGDSVTVEVRVPEQEAVSVVEVRLVGPSELLLLQDRGGGIWSAQNVHPDRWAYPLLRIDGETWYPEGCDDGGADAEERIWLSPTFFEYAAIVEETAETGDSAVGDSADTSAPGADPQTIESGHDTQAPPVEDTGARAIEPPREDPPPDPPQGCGCRGAGAAGSAWLLVLAGLGLAGRRRRGGALG